MSVLLSNGLVEWHVLVVEVGGTLGSIAVAAQLHAEDTLFPVEYWVVAPVLDRSWSIALRYASKVRTTGVLGRRIEEPITTVFELSVLSFVVTGEEREVDPSITPADVARFRVDGVGSVKGGGRERRAVVDMDSGDLMSVGIHRVGSPLPKPTSFLGLR